MSVPPRSAAAPERRASSRTPLLACIGIGLAALVVYANSFSGPFIFDDFLSIPENPTLRSLIASLSPPGGGVTVTGRPLLNLSFALNYAISGNEVWSYHALNLLIHVLAGFTLLGIVRRTLVRMETTSGKAAASSIAFASALLWTLHPLQTESVTYMVQRAESLMGLLYFLTLYCFIRGAELSSFGRVQTSSSVSNGQSTASAGSLLGSEKAWFSLALFSCLLGMATKEVMVTAPLIVLFYDRSFLAGTFREAWRRRWRLYLALAVTWLPLAGLVMRSSNRGGSAGFGAGVSFWSYAATQFEAVSHYLWLSVWPNPLIIDYGAQWVSSAAEVLPYAAFIVLLLAATVAALFRRPVLGFLGAWFFAILAPTSIVPVVRQTLAEHRMYLALAPVMVVLAWTLFSWLGRRAWFVAVAIALGFGLLTAQRNLDYRSSESIWSDTVAKRPGNAAARNNYANLLAQAGQLEAALAHLEAAIRLEPDSADAYHNAGNVLARLGRFPQAIASYEQALRRNAAMPDAHTSLGKALEDTGRVDEAVAHYLQALKLNPRYVDAHNYLGIVLAQAGRPTEAIEHFEQALRIASSRADIHSNLGNALRMADRTSEAVQQYEQALKLEPDNVQAHRGLANALRDMDRLSEAIPHYEQALKNNPDQPVIQNDLGMVLCVAGRPQEAIPHFETALRLDPEAAQVHLNLALALENTGRTQEAAAHFAAARRLGADIPVQR